MAALLLGERYQTTQKLGAGGMAEVFLGDDLRLGRQIAIKILRPQFAEDDSARRRFLDEARSLAGFSHPNVVNVYDVGKEGDRYYIVMEYVPGEDLRHQMERIHHLPVREALNTARQVAQGIGAAHRKGLVHRDLKPGNILIKPTGEAKVADFGIAKTLAHTSYTEPGIVWGTTAYLSPEQVRGEAATPASDVYALGVVLYEMLAGTVPFQGDDRVAVALKHLHDPPPPFDPSLKVPKAVTYMVQRALAKNPADRYANADEMAQAFAEYLRLPTGAQPALAPANNGGGTTRLNPSIAAPRPRPPRQEPRATTQATPPRPVRGASPARHPIDGLAILLFVAMIAAVGGLVPLFYAILQRYL